MIIKKIILILICVLTFLLGLTSCEPSSVVNIESTAKENITTVAEESTTVEDEVFLNIVTAGKSDFTIIYPTGDTVLSKLGVDVRNQIETYLGPRLKNSEDEYAEANSESFEILIGHTNREETKEALGQIPKDKDYIIGVFGNKLVITGNKNETTEKAVNYFLNKYVYVSKKGTKDGDLFFSLKDNYCYSFNYDINTITCLGVDISKFQIVYPAGSTNGELYVAENFRYFIWDKSGIRVEIADDTAPETEYEILVGNVKRSTTTAESGKFTVVSEGKKLMIAAGSALGYLDADEYLTGKLFKPAEKNVNIETVAYCGSAVSELSAEKKSSLRIIFNNILDTGVMQAANRDDYLAALYIAYKPDVIGLQEYVDEFRQLGTLPNALEKAGYTEAIPTNTTRYGIIPLYYNAKTLSLKECGYEGYFNDGSRYKGVTWGLFEEIATGKEIIICSTHFQANTGEDYTDDITEGSKRRLSDAGILLALIDHLRIYYPGVTILVGGDFNFKVTDEPYLILTDGGAEDARSLSEVSDDVCSCHSYPTYSGEFGAYVVGGSTYSKYNVAIDHVFGFGSGVVVKSYKTIVNSLSALSSDHFPIMIDFDIS